MTENRELSLLQRWANRLSDKRLAEFKAMRWALLHISLMYAPKPCAVEIYHSFGGTCNKFGEILL